MLANSGSEPTDLKLSESQQDIFAGWQRPSESLSKGADGQKAPNCGENFMMAMDQIDLVQDITTDCSVVASLCAGTARASKGYGKVFHHFTNCLLFG